MQAVHFRLARPVEIGQLPVSRQRIRLGIIRHFQPVNPAHIFPPSEDLPDEPFNRVERCQIRAIGKLRPLADFPRSQQSAIEIGRQERVKQKRLTLLHRILHIPEGGQTRRDKMIERRERIRTRHAPAKRLERAIMRFEPLPYESKNLPRDLVRLEPRPPRQAQPARQGLPVVAIIIPLATRRRVAIHQKSALPPHLAIEELHPQLLASVRPAGKPGAITEKPVIGADFNGHTEFLGQSLHHRQNPKFTRLRQHNLPRTMTGNTARDFPLERARIIGVIQLDILNLKSLAL